MTIARKILNRLNETSTNTAKILAAKLPSLSFKDAMSEISENPTVGIDAMSKWLVLLKKQINNNDVDSIDHGKMFIKIVAELKNKFSDIKIKLDRELFDFAMKIYLKKSSGLDVRNRMDELTKYYVRLNPLK
jgi:hypothetical protein